MKVLKVVLGIVVVIALLFVIYLFTLPSSYKVERSVTINAPSEMVMSHIANFKEWESWSPWKAKDPAAKYTYEGTDGEVGSRMSWVTSLPDDSAGSPNYIGEGGMVISAIDGNKMISYDLAFIKPWESSSKGFFELSEAEGGGTMVKWYDTGELPFIMRPMGKMMDAMIGPDFEAGLATLKAHVEEHASSPATGQYTMEEVTVETGPYLSITDSCPREKIGEKMSVAFQMLGSYLEEYQMQPTGPSFAYYHSWTDEGTRFEVCFPIPEETKGNDVIKPGNSYAGNAVKATFTGSYDNTEAVHTAIQDYIKNNGKEMAGSPFEIYVKGVMDTQNPDEYITEVYYPIM